MKCGSTDIGKVEGGGTRLLCERSLQDSQLVSWGCGLLFSVGVRGSKAATEELGQQPVKEVLLET